MAQKKSVKFWENGVQFQCQGSGNCCVTRNGYGYVWLTKEDRVRMAAKLGMSTGAFTRKYCSMENEVWKLKDSAELNCVFLEGKRCSIYEARPTQCRTWPFWPETMNAKAWNTEVAAFCPGVGKGRVWTREEVEAQLRDQQASENRYGS